MSKSIVVVRRMWWFIFTICLSGGIQRSVVMNGVVVGLLVLFVIAVVGAIVVALLRTFVVIYRHGADRSRLVPLARQSI